MNTALNPACRNAKKEIYTREVYTIQGNRSIFYYKRIEAIEKTREVAKAKQTVIIIMLNEVRFCVVKKDGSYEYIYNPETDYITSPKLKQFFINNGCVKAELRQMVWNKCAA